MDQNTRESVSPCAMTGRHSASVRLTYPRQIYSRQHHRVSPQCGAELRGCRTPRIEFLSRLQPQPLDGVGGLNNYAKTKKKVGSVRGAGRKFPMEGERIAFSVMEQ